MAGDYGLTQFQWDEKLDLKNYTIWIGDLIHGLPLWAPNYIWGWCDGCANGMQYAGEMLSIPGTKGWDWRIVDGIAYLAVIEPKPEEMPEREKVFRKKMAEIIDNFDELWAKDRDEIMERYEPLKKANVAELSNVELSQLFNDYLNVHKRQWEIHFYWLYVTGCVRALFDNTLMGLVGLRADDPLAAHLLGGFDNMLFKLNKEIWKLGNRAKDFGLGELFVNTTDDKGLYSKLSESEAGKKWLAEYGSFLQEYGWRNTRMLDWCNPSWIEEPSLGMRDIRNAVAFEETFTLDEKRKQFEEKRKKVEQEILGKIPEDQRSWLKKLMDVSLKCQSWAEEHNFYLDLYTNALGRKVTWEIGKRFARAGVIDDPNDVYMLMPWEIRKAIVTMERINLRPYAEARRKEWEENCKKPPVPFIGNIEALGNIIVKDPLIAIEASPPKVREELKADLYGAGAAPGVVEGIARVIMDETGLSEIKPGEILVAPTTGAPWTPVFSMIAGVVTDHGGCLAHAAIVAREYGIPAVVGTHAATQMIKTGMKIKVDGNNNAVWILG